MPIEDQSPDTAEPGTSPAFQPDVPPAQWRLQNWIAAAVLLTFAGIAIWYAAVIPVGEGVDEIPHFEYVLYLKDHKALPVQPRTIDDGVEVWMGHHPPLYYALGAAIVSAIDTSDAKEAFPQNEHFVWSENDGRNGWNVVQHYGQDTFPGQGAVLGLRIVRLTNIVLSLVGLTALLLAGRMLFGNSSWLPIGIVSFIAFNPSFIFMTATVHHDVLLSALFALGILWMVYLLKEDDISRGYYVLGGFLASAAMLTKLSGAALALTMALAILLKVFPRRSWRQFVMPFVYTFGTVFLLAGWWYLRNWALYGDPFGWSMFLTIHQHMVRQGAYTLQNFFGGFLAQVSRTFWGAFGYMHITFPGPSRTLNIAAGIAFLGFVVALLRGRLKLRHYWRVWLLLAAVLFLLFTLFVRFSIATKGAGHARYLFPAFFVLGIIIVVGLNELTIWRFPRLVTFLLATGLAWYSVWLPSTLALPKYAPPESIMPAELPAQARRIDQALGNGLVLVATEVENENNILLPGRSIPVTLYWRSDSTENIRDEQYQLALLHGKEVLASHTDWPVPSLAPDNWQEDRLYVSRAIVHPPAEIRRGTVRLEIWTVSHKQAAPSDPSLVLANFVLQADTTRVAQDELPNPREVVYGDQLALRGFDLERNAVSSGEILPVELFWQVVQRPQAEYTTFVHAVDENGALVAQCDRPLGGDSWLTTEWSKDERYRQLCPIVIPQDLAPGEYALRVGLYAWPSLERLPITKGGGEDSLDAFHLSRIQVVPQD